MSSITYNHRQAVRHGDQISSTKVRARLIKVAQRRRARRDRLGGHARLVVLKTELASVLTNDLDILPAKSFKSLSSHLAKRGGKVNEVYAREEGGHVDESGHGLNVEASSAANL
jgi:hypothetical protein